MAIFDLAYELVDGYSKTIKGSIMYIQTKSNVKEVQTTPICTEVRPSLFNNNSASAEVRCTLKRSYVNSPGSEELDVLYGREFQSERVTFIPVPNGTTVEQVNEELNKFPHRKIIRILSLEPILTPNQVRGIEQFGQEVFEKIKARQMVKGSDGNAVLWEGKPQYARNFLLLEENKAVIVDKETGEAHPIEGYTVDIRGKEDQYSIVFTADEGLDS